MILSKFAPLLLLFVAVLSACDSGARNAGYRVLTGEAPGDRPGYVSLEGKQRLGLSPPTVPTRRYQPAPAPSAKSAPGPKSAAVKSIIDAYGQRRRLLRRRELDASFRLRTLRLAAANIKRQTAPLVLQAGDVMPADTPALRARLKAAEDHIARTRAEVLNTYGSALRNDRDRASLVPLRAAIARLQKDPNTGAANRAVLRRYDRAIVNSDKTALALSEMLKQLTGNYIEYLNGQQAAINNYRQQLSGQTPAARN